MIVLHLLGLLGSMHDLIEHTTVDHSCLSNDEIKAIDQFFKPVFKANFIEICNLLNASKTDCWKDKEDLTGMISFYKP